MSKKNQATLSTAPSDATALAPASNTHDELAALGDVQFDNDGLDEIDSTDIRIAAKVFNFKGVDAKGRKIPEDAFYDTVDETVKEQIDAAFLHLHKTNLYSVYDNDEGRTRIVCRSFDRETGTMEDGLQRPCEGCPDAEWRTENGKRTRNCGPVYNMFAVDRETQLPFVVRFKRTSLPVIKSYLQKHHIGRRIVKGKRENYPLYCFQADLSCKMSDDGKYALPVLTRGAPLQLDEIKAHAENAKFLRENMFGILEKTEEVVAASEAPDTSFDPEKFGGEQGKDFVDSPAAE
jgi:hypothetical protein